MAGAVHKQLLGEAYALFALANPMHSDIFPSVRKMEGEVVAMTASILGGEPEDRAATPGGRAGCVSGTHLLRCGSRLGSAGASRRRR
jgi:glutamate/tyrosine decarboxylase-like PLP-dependent enzyme